LDLEHKLTLTTRNVEEIVTLQELRELLEIKTKPKAYWGFESSGLMHVGMGIVCGSKIKDMIKAGFEFTIFLADWHSWINNKLGGNMENIRVCGEYFRQCFTALGIKPDSVHYVWASDIAKDIEYWEKVIRIAKSSSIKRIWRALPVMGRETSLTDMETAWVYYPCMQAADIFHMNIDVACAGMDQRKAHMLARDSAEKLGWKKPVCIHTHLLRGLQEPEKTEKQFDEDVNVNVEISSKMSKSAPQTCIFVHDTSDEIKAKVKAAYCPPKQVEGNPVFELVKYVIFAEKERLDITRPSKYGGPQSYKSYEETVKAYLEGKLHPLDLKNGVAEALIEILKPVREYFRKHPQTLEKMMEIEITR
jgi:tyrosyl-tRNA synthetase